MRTKFSWAVGLLLVGSATLHAQDVIWRPASAPASTPAVTLGQPKPLSGPGPIDPPPSSSPRVVRGQIGEPPPPPPPNFIPGGGSPAPVFVPSGPGNAGLYNSGAVTHDGDLGGFWSRTGDWFQRCWGDIYGNTGDAFKSDRMFRSDDKFDVFTSPMTNPFYAMDPRAQTDIRPFFMWQKTPNSNPVWNGGNNFDYGLAGSVAFTPNISFVFNRVGFTTISPHGGVIGSATGFSELMLGPKLTFIRSETSNTVAAVGLTFDIPTGSASDMQNTGHMMLIPYFSIAQNFGRSDYGSFNFMNTTGYNFRTDNTRTESFFSSFHLDYNILNRFYPLVELNWRNYTRSGGARDLSFEGNDLANFGSQHIAGQNELTLALGMRYVINKNITFGIAGEFNVLPNGNGQHLDQFRLTTDFIFRY
jgi:Putative MetA-pathway of phenol degradation